MATLEKIRSKSVFLIVVIGVALLAFIIGDALTNSRNLFGDHTTVAKIGGEKIDYTDYARKREELNNQLEQMRRQNPAQAANFDPQLLSQMALDQLVAERLLDKAAEDAGIQTSGEQLRFYVLDNPINPSIQTIIQQLNQAGLAVSNPSQAYEVIFNPKRNGLTEAAMAPYQHLWLNMEQETMQMIKRQQYQQLLYGTMKANELDKKALYNDYVATSNVEVAYHPYGQLDPAKYAVTDQEIAAAYNENKGQFKVDDLTKDISFIAVNITPSVPDREEARMLATKTARALRDSAGQVARDLRKEGVIVTHKELRARDLTSGQVKDYVLSAAPDSVKIISENLKGFTIVKMGRRTTAVDSIQLNIVQVVGEQLPAKVLASLNSGLPVDSVSKRFSADSVMAQTGQWIALYNAQGRTNALESSQLDSLTKAGGRFINLVSTPQGAVLAQVAKRNAPVEIYSFDEVTYDLKPSTKTINEEREKLEKFLDENSNAKDFIANAAKAGYSVQQVSLNSGASAVPRMAGMQSYYPDSRQVVRWVMIDGKPGAVSHIYESKDALTPALYAAAVVDEYSDYVPLTNKDVNTFATDRARKSKAGDELVKQYQAKATDMTSVAQAMAVEAKTDSTFRFGRNARVRDAAVVGKIAGSQPGKVVVVKGDNGVYAYQINGQNTENFPYSEQQYEQQYYQLVSPNLGEMLKGSKKYKNNIFKFEAGD
ncbi:MAG: SurA N-terminal domain-containing protein [Muribaculaceae bacterium]|nr:SurA N-terminal domain-containing protein [Muribaculaceae bacterium]MDE6796110.1 SurA N-terminal domain-containing protein [Muribaculaceae bacterium]